MQCTHANVEYLQEHGPAPLPELPNERVSRPDKQAGVAAFDPGANGGVGKATQVYYLLGEHDPEPIVERWLTANADRVADTPDRSIVRACNEAGTEFGDAAHALLDTKRSG